MSGEIALPLVALDRCNSFERIRYDIIESKLVGLRVAASGALMHEGKTPVWASVAL